jgi:hypothetical protein
MKESRGNHTVSSSFPRRLGEPSSLAASLASRAPAKKASGGPDEMYLLPATCCRQSQLFRFPTLVLLSTRHIPLFQQGGRVAGTAHAQSAER